MRQPFFLLFFSCVNLCQSALTGFTEAVVQIDAGLVHGTADHIIADVLLLSLLSS